MLIVAHHKMLTGIGKNRSIFYVYELSLSLATAETVIDLTEFEIITVIDNEQISSEMGRRATPLTLATEETPNGVARFESGFFVILAIINNARPDIGNRETDHRGFGIGVWSRSRFVVTVVDARNREDSGKNKSQRRNKIF